MIKLKVSTLVKIQFQEKELIGRVKGSRGNTYKLEFSEPTTIGYMNKESGKLLDKDFVKLEEGSFIGEHAGTVDFIAHKTKVERKKSEKAPPYKEIGEGNLLANKPQDNALIWFFSEKENKTFEKNLSKVPNNGVISMAKKFITAKYGDAVFA